MSRSLGALSLTRSPAMRSSPEVMSSRPAIMLRVVDFPQPDGPTRMMNSPSAISRATSCTAVVPSGYFLVTLSRTMSATSAHLTLHRAGRQARDDALLEEEHEQDDRNSDDDRRRRDSACRDHKQKRTREKRQHDQHQTKPNKRGQRD